jgi:hypothetical protein
MSKTQAKRPAAQRAPATNAQTTITMSPAELEALIRRVVREEISQLVSASKPSILDDSSHEGPDDPEGDRELLTQALAVLEQYGDKPDAWTDWETFKAELKQAEAAGELPH